MVWKEQNKNYAKFRNDGADDIIKVYERTSDYLSIYVIRLPFTDDVLKGRTNKPSWLLCINYPSQMSDATLLSINSTRKEAYDKMEKYMREHP